MRTRQTVITIVFALLLATLSMLQHAILEQSVNIKVIIIGIFAAVLGAISGGILLRLLSSRRRG